jgi:hypothetical protein
MEVAVIQDNDVENGFEINLCCATCAKDNYGWNQEQFQKIKDAMINKTAVPIPASIQTAELFIAYIKTLS